MPIVLVVYWCLVGGSDATCDIAPVAQGFHHPKQCTELSRAYIMPAWVILNPDKEMRRWTCTDKAQALLYGRKA